MKPYSLVVELHLPENFCDQHTQTDIFQKQLSRVQDIPKRVNPPKNGNQKFARKQYFLLFAQKKVKMIRVMLMIRLTLSYTKEHGKLKSLESIGLRDYG